MNTKIRLTGSLALALLLAGCANKDAAIEVIGAAEGVHSRHVALMPYNNQGMTVAGGTTWYYGEGQGISAHAVEGGIVYVVDSNQEQASISYQSPVAASPLVRNPVEATPASESESSDKEATPTAVSAVRLMPDDLAAENQNQASPLPATRTALSLDSGLYCSSSNDSENMQGPELLVRVHFLFGSSETLYEPSQERLRNAIKEQPTAQRVHIIGYTDDRGIDAVNNPLSLARADHIKEMMLAHWPNLNITTEGRGTCPQLTDNGTSKGRAMNRRVEVYLF